MFASHVMHCFLLLCIHKGIPFLMNASVDNGSEIPGSICVTCIFVTGIQLNNASCFINVIEAEGSFFSAIAFKEEGSNNGSVCILNLITGVYTITVRQGYCTNGSSMNMNAFVYSNITVTGYDIGVVPLN